MGSVKDLNAKIRAFVDGWNDRYHPFVWTKTADEIPKKADRHTTSNTDHETLICYSSGLVRDPILSIVSRGTRVALRKRLSRLNHAIVAM